MSSVVVFVFDGLQPAQVGPRLTPNLSAWAAGGVTFANHHSVFPTVTRVNASSMVTGLGPGGHGLAGNRFLIRDFDPDRAMSEGPHSVTFENFARLMDGVRSVTPVGADNRVPLRAQPIAV